MTDIEPGRLIRLHDEAEENDAEALLGVARGCRELLDSRKTAAKNVMKKALSEIWEGPRLPRGRDRTGSFPLTFPWSKEALERLATTNRKHSNTDKWFNRDHVRPAGLIVEGLMLKSAEMRADEVIEFLHARLAYAILTEEEHKLLEDRGLSSSPTDQSSTDVWSRYKEAGFDMSTFAVPGTSL